MGEDGERRILSFCEPAPPSEQRIRTIPPTPALRREEGIQGSTAKKAWEKFSWQTETPCSLEEKTLQKKFP